MNENLRATSEALKLVKDSYWQPKPYRNRRGVWGASVVFWAAGQYHMISVHNWEKRLRPSDLVALIEGIERLDNTRWGSYSNQKQVLGFYAIARSSTPLDGSPDHWIMIGRSPERNFLKLLGENNYRSQEEDDIVAYLERTKYDQRFL